MTGGLFHKPKDTNIPPTNSLKAPTANFSMISSTSSTDLNEMQGGTNPVGNDKNAGRDADNVEQVWSKPRCHTDIQQKTVVFGKVESLSKSKVDKDTMYKGPKKTISINMTKRKDRFKVAKLLDFSVTMSVWQLLDQGP